ncbi:MULTISPECIES: DUF2334 domain-containing protein [Tenacibaculum]|uniref:DUF2334 domain-containing protein n=1 Tax=Tenacibaculum TaxID=104267 RepID=UPI001F0AC597|nr:MULTISPECIES: DUF2334 domain-containing protein [Tenacibaculum]MCH3883140.1 DUF2334 domain-containing protein [Tenacibaculum aquimarinum]MDO6600878.1 DUF2334 domain-containing protein [Tenacibaculum sp. 1_MG-2023]
MLNWLPKGKKAAICFTIDDIHPGKSSDFYEAGGDLDKGSLGYVQRLMDKHPKLKTTLFTTADWREISPVPTRKLAAKIPFLKDKMYLAKVLKKGTMALDKHPEFIKFLNNETRFEIGLHGLHHIHKGEKLPQEFQNQTEEEFDIILKKMLKIFDDSGIKYVKGICPPSWHAPDKLQNQLIKNDIKFVASARDIFTPISEDAKTNMSGLKDLPLIYPTQIKNNKLIHFPSNFQATSKPERAFEIIENRGLLAIKAHIIKNANGMIALDGVDQLYMNYLDVLLTEIEGKYGDDIWWTTMGEMSEFISKNN